MPERQHASLFGGKIARSENSVGSSVKQRPQQLRVICGVILEIRILDKAEITRRILDGVADGSSLALVLLVTVEPDTRVFRGKTFQDVVRPVRRTVVHHDQFAFQPLRQRSIQHHAQAALCHSSLIVDGNQDRNEHSVPLSPKLSTISRSGKPPEMVQDHEPSRDREGALKTSLAAETAITSS